MAPGLRSSERSDDAVMCFLRSSEFTEIISNIIKSETSPLREEITALRSELNILKESNIELIKLLSLKSVNLKNIPVNNDRKISENPNAIKVTYADKVSTNKNPGKKFFKNNTANKTDADHAENIDTQNTSAPKSNSMGNKLVKNAKFNVVYGTADKNCSIKAVRRFSHFHVSRLDPNLTVEELLQYLQGRDIANAKLEKLQSKYPEQYSSFKVSVPSDQVQDVLNPELWPTDTCINRFFFRVWQKNKSP